MDAQLDRCKAYCAYRQIPLDDVDIFTDGGISGSTTNRPELTKMMAGVENGLYQSVIIAKLDRISRSIVDFTLMLDNLSAHNVALVSVAENLDMNSAMGRLVSQILMVFAEFERNQDIARTKDAIIAMINMNMYPYRDAPFGYTKDANKHLHIDPKQKEMFDFIKLELFKTKNFRDVLASCLLKYPEEMWTEAKISKICKQATNIGGIKYMGAFYPNKFPSLCTDGEYNKMTDIIKHRSKERKYTYIYKNLLECHNCHATLICTSAYNHQKKLYLYYQCPKCKKLINEQTVSSQIKPLIKNIIKVDDTSLKKENKKISGKINQLTKLMEEFFTDFKEEKISIDDYITARNRISKQITTLEKKLKLNNDKYNNMKENIFYKQNDIDQFLIMHKNTEKIEVDLIEKKILTIEYLVK